MRLVITLLVAVLLMLQYELWLAGDGLREVWHLEAEVAARTSENEDKEARNAALEAEVIDLKQGLAAVEEKARNELGMVGQEETFYLITVLPDRKSDAAQ